LCLLVCNGLTFHSAGENGMPDISHQTPGKSKETGGLEIKKIQFILKKTKHEDSIYVQDVYVGNERNLEIRATAVAARCAQS